MIHTKRSPRDQVYGLCDLEVDRSYMAERNAYGPNTDGFDDSELYADGFDPLADDPSDDTDNDEIAETFGYIGNPESLAPRSTVSSPNDAHKSIDGLFSDMPSFRQRFLHILEYCREPRTLEQIDGFIVGRYAQQRGVYSTASYCQMLATAGALSKISEDGTPYSQVKAGPVKVERDGRVFLEPSPPPTAYWLTTDSGSTVLEEVDPLGALQAIFGKQSRYLSVFREILELCNRCDGASIDEIKQKANLNPVLEYPAKTAQFFMEYLDREGAIIWDSRWKTTSIGKQALALLGQGGGTI